MPHLSIGKTSEPTLELSDGRIDYDAELQRHHEVLLKACCIGIHEHVLDIGCGAGRMTRDAARLAAAGSALGVDSSAPMIKRARERAELEQLRNVTFVEADAEIYRFPSESFDVAISRFGTMFFADPIRAFANIGQALRPGGRLVMMVWQSGDQNEWYVSIQRSLAVDETSLAEFPGTADPFSLADMDATQGILAAAGFTDVACINVQEPVYYGRNVATAFEWIRKFLMTEHVLQRLDPSAREQASERLRSTLAAHDSG